MVKVIVGNKTYYTKSWDRWDGGINLYNVVAPQACKKIVIVTNETITVYEGLPV
jgi:hypothetical protein